MSSVKVNRDMLTAYLEGALSPDAERSLRLALETDGRLRRVLEQERRLLAALDGLAQVEPPTDFVAGVMGRVAQQPAYRPRRAVAWGRVVRWTAAVGFAGAATLVGVLAWALTTGALDGGLLGAWLANALAGGIDAATDALRLVQGSIEPARALIEEASKLAWRLLTASSAAGWALQATLLLLTVSLNYALTRLVVNYQRRR